MLIEGDIRLLGKAGNRCNVIVAFNIKLSSISALFILLFHVKRYCFCTEMVAIRWSFIVLKAQGAR